MAGENLDPGVLGRLLVMQSLVSNLPDDQAILSFVCRGLQGIPGVGSVSHQPTTRVRSADRTYKAIRMGGQEFGVLELVVPTPPAFLPYEPYVDNFCFTVAVILEERRQRKENRAQKERLEAQTLSLEQSLKDLGEAQARVVEAQKLALLGQLTGSITHQLNTPLGAIRSSATSIQHALEEEVPDFLGQIRRLDDPDFRRFLGLLFSGSKAIRSGGMKEHFRHSELRVQLLQKGIPDPEPVVEAILTLAPPGEEAPLLSLVDQGKSALVILAGRLRETVDSTRLVGEASDRATAIVAALRRFSTSGPGQELLDPAADLEALLLLQFGVSGQSFTIERRFEPGLTFPGDRNQVHGLWTRLLDRLMGEQATRGTIILGTREVNGGVEVSVADNRDLPLDPEDRKFIGEVAEGHRGAHHISYVDGWTTVTVRFPR